MDISFTKHFLGGRGSSGVAQWIPRWEVTPSRGLILPPVQVSHCDCLRGKQRALHATVSDSSGLHSFCTPHPFQEEHTWGLSFSLEKRLQSLAGGRVAGT